VKTSEEFRQLSREMQEALEAVRQGLGEQHERLVTAVTAAVMARVYAAMADLLEMVTPQEPVPASVRSAVERLVTRNQQLRKAVLDGDWHRVLELDDVPSDESGGDAGGEPAG